LTSISTFKHVKLKNIHSAKFSNLFFVNTKVEKVFTALAFQFLPFLFTLTPFASNQKQHFIYFKSLSRFFFFRRRLTA